MRHFQGLPITIKATKGIELAMDIQGAILHKELSSGMSKAKETLV